MHDVGVLLIGFLSGVIGGAVGMYRWFLKDGK